MPRPSASSTTGGQICMVIKRLYAPVDRVDELADARLSPGGIRALTQPRGFVGHPPPA